jgi:hypothetical protein
MGFPGTGQKGDVDNLNAENSYSRWATHMNTVAATATVTFGCMPVIPLTRISGSQPGARNKSGRITGEF